MNLNCSEAAAQKAVMQYLSIRGYLYWRNNTGGFFGKKEHFYRFGKVGSGDILGVMKGGRFFSIEMKRRGKKATPQQEAFMQSVNAAGGLAFVAYDVDDVVKQGF